jgi:hypothetical protein
MLGILQQYAADWKQQAEQVQQRTPDMSAATATAAAPGGGRNGGGVSRPWSVNAVAAAGFAPLKFAAVPAAEAPAVCKQLLMAAAAAVVGLPADTLHPAAQQQQQQQQQWPSLLPFGCCSKLHLWPELPAADRPCFAHLQFLAGAAVYLCRCRAGRHVSLQELQDEVQHQLVKVYGVSSTVKFLSPADHNATRRKGGSTSRVEHNNSLTRNCEPADNSSETNTSSVGLFVSGLPSSRPAAAVRQQLLQQLSGHGVLAAAVPAVGAVRRCKGWARLLLRDDSAAAALLEQCESRLVSCVDDSPLHMW